MLLQNQAHDSICGCSIDDVHFENISRYKKIMQISNTIIDELKFSNNFKEKMILNLADKPFSGMVEFETVNEENNNCAISVREGFEWNLLTDTNRIPITEDYKKIYKFIWPLF